MEQVVQNVEWPDQEGKTRVAFFADNMGISDPYPSAIDILCLLAKHSFLSGISLEKKQDYYHPESMQMNKINPVLRMQRARFMLFQLLLSIHTLIIVIF